MHKSATKCNETLGKWCKNKHGASKIMDTLEMYHRRGRPGAAHSFVLYTDVEILVVFLPIVSQTVVLLRNPINILLRTS
jgi:hypothetical protein